MKENVRTSGGDWAGVMSNREYHISSVDWGFKKKRQYNHKQRKYSNIDFQTLKGIPHLSWAYHLKYITLTTTVLTPFP